ncbi:MAG TPA: AraC family transcriptional regulator [Streptosporangiaceae bacterium]
MSSAVDRAVTCIWERYSDSLSLADIARSATLSRFHFARLFKEQTGVSPGQFLAAVRIYQAKRMLLASSVSVAGVSSAVGYGSLGSFTSHFTDSVGMSPSRFRRASHCRDLTECGLRPESVVPADAAMGTVRLPEGYAGARVYVGVFDTPIMQRRPYAAALIDVTSQRTHSYWLPLVPEGNWFLHAVAVADTDEPEPWTRRHLLVGGGGRVQPDLGSIALRPRSQTDLPALLALPDFEAELEDLTRSVAAARGW